MAWHRSIGTGLFSISLFPALIVFGLCFTAAPVQRFVDFALSARGRQMVAPYEYWFAPNPR